MSNLKVNINKNIRSSELRVIGSEGENLGVISLSEALKLASDSGLDLIEISPNANPPVAKIADYGKFQYEEKKRRKVALARQHTVEVKQVQVKIGTGDRDLELKAKKASEWLKEGHRVRVELFLVGRSKYMDIAFLKERMERIFRLITIPFKVSEEPKKGPKGLTAIIEKN